MRPTILINNTFDSFEEFAVLANSWDADFRQLDAEKFKSTMFQAILGPMLISSARLGCHVEQFGSTPADMYTFALPDTNSPEVRWYGQTVEPGTLVSFPSDGEIDVFSRPGFGVSTFSLPSKLLMNLFEQHGVPWLEKILLYRNKVWQATDTQLNKIRFLLKLVETGKCYNSQMLLDEFQDQLLSILIQNSSALLPDLKIPRQKQTKQFKLAIDYIHSNERSTLRNSELCDVLGVSVRTLQNLFKKEIGMTPKAYLNGQRIYGVHRELWQSSLFETKVIDIANKWGFWHMGQFSADYKKIFDEKPLDTLKRSF